MIDRALALVVLGGDEEIAQLSEHPFDLKSRFEAFRPVGPVSRGHLSVELLLSLITHQPLFADQPVHHADGEGATAEPEGKDVVALVGAVFLFAIFCFGGGGFERQIAETRAIVAAGKLVDSSTFRFRPKPKAPPRIAKGLKDEYRPRRRRMRSVASPSDRATSMRPPHIGAPDLAGGIAGAVRQRMIRLLAIRTLAQTRSRETGIFVRAREKFLF